MKNPFSTGKVVALLLVIGSVCLGPAEARAVDPCMPYWTESYKRMQGCLPGSSDSGGNSGLSRRQIREMEEAAEDAARNERNRRVTVLNQQGGEAWDRKDYRQALRYYEQQQAVIDGPNVRRAIVSAKAMIAWQEARNAADYRRALAIAPEIFPTEWVRYVEGLEAREKDERERPEREARWERERLAREAADRETAARMREKIGRFATSLDTEPAAADLTVSHGRAIDGAMGGSSVEAPLEFGNPDDLEAQSEQLRQGFDKAGLLKGSTPVPVPGDPAGGDPRMVAATQEIDRLQAEQERMDVEIARLTRERNSSGDAAQMKALTEKLEQKSLVRQEKLLQISQQKEQREKLRRSINTQVEKAKEKPL